MARIVTQKLERDAMYWYDCGWNGGGQKIERGIRRKRQRRIIDSFFDVSCT